ncbi:flagellar hook protein FlgE [Roseomonas gilardii subsp. gilardii]|uniref:flagellar hook protein FlgE n=1 Tax=Roseomonas gilardii TaxID=257708 RepID=UPI001FF8F250|nr:flagellar hook protein FlgE [Roseomonas gilardii]UPG74239.1 flagellar hook protein FlgE [Roseomonas gilardii subsp. gilardii]
MSLYGSMFTAISGLSAQSSALSNVANNIANSQTTGYKRVDTSFSDYVTATNASTSSGVPITSSTVIASGSATNAVQGSIQQTGNALDLAVSGQGFFSVSSPVGDSAVGNMSFDPRSFYTRAGDFSLNQQGYLVNSQGYYLNGWSVDDSGAVNRTEIAPIRVDQGIFDPVATSGISLSANLPNDAATGTAVSSQLPVYDKLGTQHMLGVTFTKAGDNSWSMAVSNPDSTTGSTNLGSVTLNFADGKLASFSDATGNLSGNSGAAGEAASVSLGGIDFGQGAQAIQLGMGSFQRSDGMTQFTGTEYTVRDLSQNGMPPGAFSSVSINEAGDVSLNYDNGESKVIARVPVVTFSDPDKLQAVNGQAYLRTPASGDARASDPNSSGAGSLVTGALEQSNVDIASEFSKMILAQRAYSANTKIVTKTDEMLQDTLNMAR